MNGDPVTPLSSKKRLLFEDMTVRPKDCEDFVLCPKSMIDRLRADLEFQRNKADSVVTLNTGLEQERDRLRAIVQAVNDDLDTCADCAHEAKAPAFESRELSTETIALLTAERAALSGVSPSAVETEAKPLALFYTTRQYPCGCRAEGSGDVPAYCSTHGSPPARAAAKASGDGLTCPFCGTRDGHSAQCDRAAHR